MNVTNKVVETTELRPITEMISVTTMKAVIVKKTQNEFILDEKEALLLRDLMGSTSMPEAFDRLSKYGCNYGKWTKKDFEDIFLKIFLALDKNTRRNNLTS